MQEKLFDESPPVEPTPAQLQSRAKNREVDRLRQKRHRAKKRDRSPENVTDMREIVTLFTSSSVEAQLPPAEVEAINFEMRLLLAALGTLSDAEANRSSLLRALDNVARDEGIDIFHAARFLDGAIERGALPRLERVEWVSIPRPLLAQLLAD